MMVDQVRDFVTGCTATEHAAIQKALSQRYDVLVHVFMGQFHVGNRISVAHRGRTVTGTVTKVNVKSLQMRRDDNGRIHSWSNFIDHIVKIP